MHVIKVAKNRSTNSLSLLRFSLTLSLQSFNLLPVATIVFKFRKLISCVFIHLHSGVLERMLHFYPGRLYSF